MKIIQYIYAFIFLFASLSTSAQGIIITNKEVGGGNPDDHYKCIEVQVTFYTIYQLPQQVIDNINISVISNTSTTISDLESTLIEQSEECVYYSNTYTISSCCSCNESIERSTCPIGMIIDLSANDGECLSDVISDYVGDLECIDLDGSSMINPNAHCNIYRSFLTCDYESDEHFEDDNSNNTRESAHINKLKIVPNPVYTVLNIYNFNENSLFRIVDLNGNVLKTEKSVGKKNKMEIDLLGFPSGLYFVQRIDENLNVETVKFLKL